MVRMGAIVMPKPIWVRDKGKEGGGSIFRVRYFLTRLVRLGCFRRELFDASFSPSCNWMVSDFPLFAVETREIVDNAHRQQTKDTYIEFSVHYSFISSQNSSFVSKCNKIRTCIVNYSQNVAN